MRLAGQVEGYLERRDTAAVTPPGHPFAGGATSFDHGIGAGGPGDGRFNGDWQGRRRHWQHGAGCGFSFSGKRAGGGQRPPDVHEWCGQARSMWQAAARRGRSPGLVASRPSLVVLCRDAGLAPAWRPFVQPVVRPVVRTRPPVFESDARRGAAAPVGHSGRRDPAGAASTRPGAGAGKAAGRPACA